MVSWTMDPWARQRRMAVVTAGWSALSLVVGTRSASSQDRWWRSFGTQCIGWAAVDLAVVGVVEGVQARRRSRMPDPYAAAVLAREARQLHRVLVINALLDAGYCLTGLLLWHAKRRDPRAAGAGVAIMIQGGFLLLHDSHHAYRGRRSGT